VSTELLAALGERIRTLREAAGLLQMDLAHRVGLSRTSITNLEAGRQGNIPLDRLLALATALDTTVAVLVGEAPLDLPAVHVAVSYVVTCQRCGRLGDAATVEGANERRRAHIRDHLTGATEQAEA
jgi:transcriptional regulator with XRE-family HTH domain